MPPTVVNEISNCGTRRPHRAYQSPAVAAATEACAPFLARWLHARSPRQGMVSPGLFLNSNPLSAPATGLVPTAVAFRAVRLPSQT